MTVSGKYSIPVYFSFIKFSSATLHSIKNNSNKNASTKENLYAKNSDAKFSSTANQLREYYQ